MTKHMVNKKESITRRGVLKGLAIFAAIPFVDALSNRANLMAAGVSKFSNKLVANGEVITGAHWGILKVEVKNGKITKSSSGVKTTLENPLQSVVKDLVYTSTRIKYPMVRKSYLANPNSPKPELRGKDEWVKISYDKAIKLIANELKATRKAKGDSSIFAGSYGWKSSGNLHNARILLHRLMGMSGGFASTTGDYSSGATQVMMPHVLGTIETYEQQTSWPLVLEHSKVVVIWGANPLSTLRIAWTISDQKGLEYLQKLKDSKKEIIFIDPIKNETCQFLNARWIAPIPGSDVALMLGIIHTMLVSGKYDKNFVSEYVEGFNEFKDYVLGKKDGVVKDAKWASKTSSIEEKVIKELAEKFFTNRTMLMSGWGMQRAHHGEQTHWMLVALACMIGQIGKEGGGFGLSYHYSNGGSPSANSAVIGGMNAGGSSGTGQSWLLKTTDITFPVARIADALLNPGKKIDFNGKKITYPDIDFIYWAGGNPFCHHQDTNTLIKAWKKPRSIVVHDMYWTPTAKMADIVMPICTPYERNDISMSGDYSNLNIVPMKAVVKPEFESTSDYQVFSDLAKELGIYDSYTEKKSEMEWIEEYYNLALKQAKAKKLDMPTFKDFWEKNKPITFDVPMESESFVRYADFVEDPILNPLGTPSGKIELYSKVVEKMKYDDCRAYPSFFEPIEWLGMKNKPAPFALLSIHPDYRLHSQLANTSLRKKYAVNDREPILINQKDAKKKGIKNGDIVRVFNKRGQILAGAIVSDNIKEGVVCVREGAWYDPLKAGEIGSLCKNGSPNLLTIDIPSSKLANGNISDTALVDFEKYKGKAPAITAFTPPKGA